MIAAAPPGAAPLRGLDMPSYAQHIAAHYPAQPRHHHPATAAAAAAAASAAAASTVLAPPSPSPLAVAAAARRVVASVDLGSPGSYSPVHHHPHPHPHHHRAHAAQAAQAAHAAGDAAAAHHTAAVHHYAAAAVDPLTPVGEASPHRLRGAEHERDAAQAAASSLAHTMAGQEAAHREEAEALASAHAALRAELAAAHLALEESQAGAAALALQVADLQARLAAAGDAEAELRRLREANADLQARLAERAEDGGGEAKMLREANADLQARLTKATHELLGNGEEAKRQESRARHLGDTVDMLEKERDKLRAELIAAQESLHTLPLKDSEVRMARAERDGVVQQLEALRRTHAQCGTHAPAPAPRPQLQLQPSERVVEKVVECNHEEELRRLNGLTAAQDEELRRLRAQEEETARLRGTAAAQEEELKRLRALVAASDEEARRLRGADGSHQSELRRTRGVVSTQEEELRRLRGDTGAGEEEVRGMRTLLGQHEDELRRLRALAAQQEEELRRLRGLVASHEEELRRSDAIHARQCNDLIATVEETRAQRDAKDAELRRLLEQGGGGGGGGSSGNEDALRRERDRASDELQAARQEIERLRREVMSRSRASGRGEDPQLRRAYDELQAKNNAYREQLRQATVDFKQLEEHTAAVEGELQAAAAANEAGRNSSGAAAQAYQGRNRTAMGYAASAEGSLRRLIPTLESRAEKRQANDALKMVLQTTRALNGAPTSPRSASRSASRRY